MLLTIRATVPAPYAAADLGFVLMKHPQHVTMRDLTFGRASVFFPEVAGQHITAALLLEVDPVALSRTTRAEGRASEGKPLEPYVNDRPYAAGSFLAAALREMLGTAMTGKSKERQALADTPLEVVAELPCVAVRGPDSLAAGLPERLLARLFEPLGYAVEASPIPLDPQYPEWGERPYVRLRLSGVQTVAALLRHLYVLIPVLDGKKHYYVDESEIEKLFRRGEGWLEAHPERELILARYLKFRELVQQASEHLSQTEALDPVAPAAPPRVHDERLDTVARVLRETGAARVLDLGCGEGRLLARLIEAPQFSEIVGLDLSARALEGAATRLHLHERPELRGRVRLLHGTLSYPDSRLKGFEAAALVEVIEHLEPHRLAALSQNVFGVARPRQVVITTPNRDYNQTFTRPQTLRHADHRFEWSRAEFRAWAEAAAQQYGYAVRFEAIGEPHPEYGALTQMAVFERVG